MKIITTLERKTTFTEIKKALSNGTARELFGGAGSISVEVEGIGTAIFDIIGYDSEKLAGKDSKHSMTLWMRDLILEMKFSTEGNNKWEESDIRKHINSEEFINRFETGFRELICPATATRAGRIASLQLV